MSSFTRQKASSPADSQYARRSAAIASARQRRFGAMRPTSMDFFGDMGDQGSTMAMDVDDVDALEIFGGDGLIGENKRGLSRVPDGLRHLTTLKELTIQGMRREFCTTVEEGGEDFYKIQHVPSLVIGEPIEVTFQDDLE